VASSGAAALPRILEALDGAGPSAANWIRTAADAVAGGELEHGGKLPAADLEAFILQRRHDPRARRLAFELLSRIDAGAPARLIPLFEDDPSVELRRDAVTALLETAAALREKDPGPAANQVYRKALEKARDLDQVRAAAAKLKELGEPVDLARHFGFIMDWKLIGPFDHTGSKAFDVPYPPESEFLPEAEIEGKGGKVLWKAFTCQDEQGVVDLNQALGRHKGAIAYALADFASDGSRPVEFRLGTMNGWKLWLNGKLLFAHEEYHHGMEIDQFRTAGELRPGANRILLKLCQNEQTEDFAQEWRFQIRVCDATGTAILPAARTEGGVR
jgi:hypothetical protein